MAVNETIVDPKTKKTYKADENGVCKEINNGMITTKLSDAERFIEIFDIATGNIYYGGDQSWYYWSGLDGKTKIAREGGCGTVAAANIVAYLAAHNSEYEKLYEYPDYTKENFLLHMNKMYEYVTPRSVADQPLGIWPVSRLKNGIVEFAQERGIKLIAKVIDAFTTKKERKYMYNKIQEFQKSLLTEKGCNALLEYTDAYFAVGIDHKTITSIRFQPDSSSMDIRLYESDLNYKQLGDGTVSFLSATMMGKMLDIAKVKKRSWFFVEDHLSIISSRFVIDWIGDILENGYSGVDSAKLS